jgi:hypothetical protein
LRRSPSSLDQTTFALSRLAMARSSGQLEGRQPIAADVEVGERTSAGTGLAGGVSIDMERYIARAAAFTRRSILRAGTPLSRACLRRWKT